MMTFDCTDYTAEKTPFSSLPATVPNEEPFKNEGKYFIGTTNNNWYVPYRFYNIKEVRIWKDENQMSGFEFVFKVPKDFTGYEPITHMWGTKLLVSDFEVVDLSSSSYP